MLSHARSQPAPRIHSESNTFFDSDPATRVWLVESDDDVTLTQSRREQGPCPETCSENCQPASLAFELS